MTEERTLVDIITTDDQNDVKVSPINNPKNSRKRTQLCSRHLSLLGHEDAKKLSAKTLLNNHPDESVASASGSKLFQLTNYGPVTHTPNDLAVSRPGGRRRTEPASPTGIKGDTDFAIKHIINDNKYLCRFDEDGISTADANEVGEPKTIDNNANVLPNSQLIERTVSNVEEGLHESFVTVKRSRWRRTLNRLAKRGRQLAMSHRRMIEKNGTCNINYDHVKKRRLMFFSDWFTTVLEVKWRYTFLVFFFTFALTWVVFALIWWALFAGRRKDDMECVVGVYDFTTALLFSIETQHTIGYGTRSITDECPSGTLILMLQSTIGVMSQCIVTGIVFAKLARPTRRAATVLFSRNAVICQQDGSMLLMFRVGDMRRTQMMGATINAIFIQTRTTVDGDIISYSQKNLNITTISEDSFFFLAWPIKVMHKITEDSPLWNLSAEDLLEADFEIIVILEAAAETTGGGTQVRTSYLPNEILWGHKLAPLFTKHKAAGGRSTAGSFNIDFTQFDKTQSLKDTPDEKAANLVSRKDSYYMRRTRGAVVDETQDQSITHRL